MTSCREARILFDAYWDDEASQAEREWLESHWTACARCRREYDERARVLEQLAALPRVEAPADFVERAVLRARRASVEPDRVRTLAPNWVSIAAAASVLLVMGTVVTPWLMLGRRVAPLVALGERAPREAHLVNTATTGPASPAPAATPSRSQAEMVAVVDSLIDHSEDVEFVLDPVRVSRGRATVTSRPEPAQGHQAVFTF
jgi:anti-sigma factor RsiW